MSDFDHMTEADLIVALDGLTARAQELQDKKAENHRRLLALAKANGPALLEAVVTAAKGHHA